MRRVPLLAVLLSFGWFSHPLLAQSSLEDFVSQYRGENGKGYMQPLGDAFGAALNSGWFHSAHIKPNGFTLKIGLHTMTALVGDDQRNFTASTEDPFFPRQMTEAPTIFGSVEAAEVTGTGGTVYTFPPGLNIDRLPLAVPQVTVGSILGTEATVRFIQVDIDDNFKELKLVSYGLRHSLSQYVNFPFDVAAAFYRQTFDVGDIIQADATYYGIQASTSSSGMLTLFGGLGIQSSSMDISYDLDAGGDTEEISFHLESDSSFKFLLGVGLNLEPLFVFGDYNFGDLNVLSIGAGLSF